MVKALHVITSAVKKKSSVLSRYAANSSILLASHLPVLSHLCSLCPCLRSFVQPTVSKHNRFPVCRLGASAAFRDREGMGQFFKGEMRVFPSVNGMFCLCISCSGGRVSICMCITREKRTCEAPLRKHPYRHGLLSLSKEIYARFDCIESEWKMQARRIHSFSVIEHLAF